MGNLIKRLFDLSEQSNEYEKVLEPLLECPSPVGDINKDILSYLLNNKIIKVSFDPIQGIQSTDMMEFSEKIYKHDFKDYKIYQWALKNNITDIKPNDKKDFIRMPMYVYGIKDNNRDINDITYKIIEWINFKKEFEKEFNVIKLKDHPDGKDEGSICPTLTHSRDYIYKVAIFKIKDITPEKEENIKRYFSHMMDESNCYPDTMKYKRQKFDNIKDGTYVVYWGSNDDCPSQYFLDNLSKLIEHHKKELEILEELI